MNFPDTYLIPFRTLLESDKSIYLNYILNNFNNVELEFINFIKKETSNIEEKYHEFFELNCSLTEVKCFVKLSLIKFFRYTKATNYKAKSLDKNSMSRQEKNDSKAKKNTQNIFIVETKKSKKFKIYPKGYSLINEENADGLRKENQIFFGTYRILMNKSFYLFTIIKVLKIISIFEQNKAKVKTATKITKIDLEDDLFEEILRLFYFYTENNPDNCMVILSSDFAYTLNAIDKSKFEDLIDFYVNCLKTLREKNYKFSTNHTIFRIIKSIILDILVRIKYIFILIFFNYFFRMMTKKSRNLSRKF